MDDLPGADHSPSPHGIALQRRLLDQSPRELGMAGLEPQVCKAVLVRNDIVVDSAEGQDQSTDDPSSILACAAVEKDGSRRRTITGRGGQVLQNRPVWLRFILWRRCGVQDILICLNEALAR
jgi:hypothetical protein